jgi:mitochondrial fission protein ELM1
MLNRVPSRIIQDAPRAPRFKLDSQINTPSRLLPPGSSCWILSDGKIGDEVQCLGIAEALGLSPEFRRIAPRPAYAFAMPYGPIDPREAPERPGSPLAPPFPDIAVAAGRRTVPYLRALRRLSKGKTFAVFVKDPYWSRRKMNLIVAPEHDGLSGSNVFSTATPANRLHAWRLTAARAMPDPRIASLPHPRVALILGGDSQHHRFEDKDIRALAEIAALVLRQGKALMVTPSRRTPPALIDSLARTLAAFPAVQQNVLFWDGEGRNPYLSILAHADAIIVTCDSVNMVGEAGATGAPVHVYEPSGGHAKISAYLARLESLGAIRPWRGALEEWRYPPLNATPVIAEEIARRYLAFREAFRL